MLNDFRREGSDGGLPRDYGIPCLKLTLRFLQGLVEEKASYEFGQGEQGPYVSGESEGKNALRTVSKECSRWYGIERSVLVAHCQESMSLYPIPRTVRRTVGLEGSDSILRRKA